MKNYKTFIAIICLLTGAIMMGQVGIGTAAPHSSSILDIESDSSGMLIPRVPLTGTTDVTTITGAETSLLLYNTSTVSDVTPGFYYWDGTLWVRLSSEISPEWKLAGNAGTRPGTMASPGLDFIGTTDNEDFVLRTNNIEAMRITADGLVGIGTDSPDDPLDVNGDAEIGGIDGASVDFETENLKIRAQSNSWNLNVLNHSSASESDFYIGTSHAQGEAAFLIRPNGNIAIGNDDDNPDDILHIVDDQNDTTTLRIDNTFAGTDIDHTRLALFDGSTEMAFFKHNNNRDVLSIGHSTFDGSVHFYSGDSDGTNSDITMHMDNNSRVGIGKDDLTPEDILHVVDDQDAATTIRIDNSAQATNTIHTALRLYDGSLHKASFQYNNNTDVLEIGSEVDGGTVEVKASGTTAMTVTSAKTTINTLINIKPGSAPASPVEGDVYYDAVSKKLKLYTGSIWEDLN